MLLHHLLMVQLLVKSKLSFTIQVGGTSEMTPADPLGWVDADFATVGDTLTLMWTGTKWVVCLRLMLLLPILVFVR